MALLLVAALLRRRFARVTLVGLLSGLASLAAIAFAPESYAATPFRLPAPDPAAVRAAYGRPHPALPGDDRQILALDAHGQGRAIEVHGDLLHARRVAVVVPGVGSSLETFDGDHIPGDPPGPSLMGRRLHDEIVRQDPSARVAVVTWLGYEPPPRLDVQAARGDRARAGAVALEGFVDWLHRLRPDARVSLFCHSYGSVACGMAAPHLRVSDLVAFASPGMRAASVRALHTSARVWAATARTDWVNDVTGLEVGDLGHGPSPDAVAFGAHRLCAAGVTGHGGYLDVGSVTLVDFARIARGAYGEVVGAGSPGCATPKPRS